MGGPASVVGVLVVGLLSLNRLLVALKDLRISILIMHKSKLLLYISNLYKIQY